MKLSTKIFLIMASLVVISLVASVYNTERYLIPEKKKDIITNAYNTAYYLQQGIPLLNEEERQILLEKLVSEDNGIIYLLVLDMNGTAVNHSEPNRIGMQFTDEGTMQAIRKGIPVEQVYERDLNNPASPYYKQKVIDIVLPYQDINGHRAGAVNVGLSMDHLNSVRQVYYTRLAVRAFLIIILALLLTYFLWRDIIHPIRSLLSVIREIRHGNYNKVCAVQSNDELGFLTHEFNSMAERLNQVLLDLGTREKELEEARNELEDRVRIRTSELEDNIKLRQSVEIALRESEEKLRKQVEHLNTLIYNLNELFYTFTNEGIITFINRKSIEVIGYWPEELIGKNIFEFVEPTYYSFTQEQFILRVKEGKSANFETAILHKDGSIRYIRVNGSPIVEDGIITGGMSVAEDITDVREAREALRISEEKFSAAFQLSPFSMTLTHFETGRYVEVNQAWLNYYGCRREDAIGKTSIEMNVWCNADDRKAMVKSLLENKTQNNVEIYFQNPQGDKRPFLCSYTTILIDGEKHVLFVASDISEKKAMERDILIHQERLAEERLKASKLESLGVLAGGLAHDFNNLLTVINGNLSLARVCEPNEDILPLLDEIEIATLQAQDLTQQLLTFSKPGVPCKKILSVSDLLRKTVNFALSGSGIICRFQIAPDIELIEADEGQIRQVINNLIINAIQAMPHGGEIKVKAQNFKVTEESLKPLPSGRYVVLMIEDQGCGIPLESRNKIFDPYYTTKDSGSGLGLATAYAIISKHNGYITFESELGKGTTFFVYLPSAGAQENDFKEKHKITLSGEGKVLVLEDDEGIRKMLGKMLVSLGYQVELSCSGIECINLYKKALNEGNRFDVVLLDLTLPGDWGGKETFNKLLQIDSNAKVVLTSGYANDPVFSSYDKAGFAGVITKPYNLIELGDVLSKVVLFKEK